MSANKKIYFQCNPLLDISATVDESFLKPYGLAVGEAALAKEEQLGIFTELEKKPDVVYVPGGAGLNSARVCRWIGQAAGIQTVYVGCIGEDRYGEILKDAAEKQGVEMVLEKTSAAPTGTCACAIVGKERSLLANLGASNRLSAAHMKSPAVIKVLGESQYFYCTGYALIVDAEYVLQVAKAAHATPGGVFCLNLSAGYIIDCFTEALMKVLPHVDILFGNEGEAETLAKALKIEEKSIPKIAERVAEVLPYEGLGDQTIIFTQGPSDIVFASKKEHKEVVSVPSHRVEQEKVVDTNGAGDAFVGGFIAALSQGKSIKRCIEVGSYAASVVIQYDGCNFPEKPAADFKF